MKIKTPKIEEMIDEWDKDSVINPTEPEKEILNIPIIHAKYNRYLSLHNLASKHYHAEFLRMKKTKWMYYTGKLDANELTELGWEPFQFVLKSDISVYIDGDADLNNINTKRQYHEEAANFCTNVLKELNNRTWQLREHMTHERFIQGAR
jgi:hypothetical protein